MNDQMVKVILLAAVLMLVALFGDFVYLFALSFPVLMFAWMFLGALRNGSIGSGYKASLISVLVVWLGGFVTMNLMDTAAEPSVYIGGFPVATAIMVYVVWILPFILGTYAYGYFFEKDCITKEELKTLENKFRKES
ncbi:hypothetical protein PRVXH_000793 [Proteinivorax hydrogeniformans]|uniref:Uncharacterized protein n=1 Tax=Proteinivorax hydrogeniformans TaxID=1826727 RepID=A0AAU8HVT6_9FIRM